MDDAYEGRLLHSAATWIAKNELTAHRATLDDLATVKLVAEVFGVPVESIVRRVCDALEDGDTMPERAKPAETLPMPSFLDPTKLQLRR